MQINMDDDPGDPPSLSLRRCVTLWPCMQDLQRHFNYIPREGMEALAEYLGCPLSSLYSMATFYTRSEPEAQGQAYHQAVRRYSLPYPRLHQPGRRRSTRLLGIQAGETSADGLFSLELVNCLGSCALAPVMVVDGTYYGKVTMERLPEILNAVSRGGGSNEQNRSLYAAAPAAWPAAASRSPTTFGRP